MQGLMLAYAPFILGDEGKDIPNTGFKGLVEWDCHQE